jgi:hypothetical protein
VADGGINIAFENFPFDKFIVPHADVRTPFNSNAATNTSDEAAVILLDGITKAVPIEWPEA